MCDYENIKINLNNSINYSKINYKGAKIMKTIEKPLLKSINCVKVGDNGNYDCEVIEYSLRVCLVKNIV